MVIYDLVKGVNHSQLFICHNYNPLTLQNEKDSSTSDRFNSIF